MQLHITSSVGAKLVNPHDLTLEYCTYIHPYILYIGITFVSYSCQFQQGLREEELEGSRSRSRTLTLQFSSSIIMIISFISYPHSDSSTLPLASAESQLAHAVKGQ